MKKRSGENGEVVTSQKRGVPKARKLAQQRSAATGGTWRVYKAHRNARKLVAVFYDGKKVWG